MAAGRGRAARARPAALVLVILVGCTGGGDGDPDPSSSRPREVEEGLVRLGIGGDLVVDPVEASLASPSDLMVLDLLHDGLTRLDEDGVARPALADRWKADDKGTFTDFHLAPAATFASGRVVTPADVIASLERVMAAGDSSLAALSLEAVKGFRAFVDGDEEHVSGLTAPNDRTVRIALATPLSVLPEVLSNPMLSVVDADSVDAGGLEELDLSGAWSVVSATSDELRVEPREAVEPLRAVELRGYDDEESAYDGFAEGEVDWAPVPASRYAEALEAFDDEAFSPFHAELFFGMNVSSPALRNAALRQGIVAAIDQEAIVEEVYPDLADPLRTVVPAGVAGHDPDRCAGCGYDPELAEAKVHFAHPDGEVPVVRIDFDESASQDAMAELVASALDDVGIPTELRPLPLEEYKQFVVSGEQELFSFGWIGAYGSPDAYLAPLFGSAANDNLTDFRSPAVDLLLASARRGADPAAVAKLWADAEKAILAAAVVVPIAQFRTQVVVGERVQGLSHAVDGTVDWTQVEVTD